MLRELKTVKQKVEFLLDVEPATRDSDKLLYIRLIEEFIDPADKMGEFAWIIFKDLFFKEIPNMESVIRTRAYFQNNEGKYLGKNQEAKMKEGQEVREYYRG